MHDLDSNMRHLQGASQIKSWSLKRGLYNVGAKCIMFHTA